MSPPRDQAPDARYWNDVATSPSAVRGDLWRRHADAVNADLCARWWPARPVRRALKTDLFDEACGVGLLPNLAERAGSVHGTDHAVEAVRQAHSRLPGAPLLVADVRGLPYASASFDLVISNSTLDHFDNVDDIAKSFAEIHRVLAAGGRFILTLDNPLNPVVALRNALPFGWLHRTGLVPYYVGATCGPRSGHRMLAAAGFEVRQITAIMHCPRVIAVAWANRLQARHSDNGQHRFLNWLSKCERLERWPTRYLSGYFVAWMADKRD
ncbi:MAG: methyltransferase domain-containing protein [Vicinamibacterales bacterium]